ncbi:MMPL family transporter, partial [Bacteriovoracaceae bacterium]|nr:MMPL family transporter [Bacteriovoracaceae bacterium]
SDLGIFLPLCYLIFTIFLIILYRSKLGVIGPWIIISTSITMMIGFLGYLGFKINSMSSAAPTILLTVAIADSIHVLSSYYYSFKQGLSNYESALYSLRKNFYPTLLTSITTSIGFISFFGAKVQPVAELGALVCAGVMVAWLNTYLFLGPVLISLKGVKKLDLFKIDIEDKLNQTNPTFKIDLSRITPVIKLHSNKILILSTVLFLGGLFYATKLEVNMNPFEQFREEHPMVVNNNFVESHIGGTTNLEFMINTPPGTSVFEPEFVKKVEKFEQFLLGKDYVFSTTSLLDVLRNTHQKLNGGDESEYRLIYDREGLAQEYLFYTMGLPAGKELNNLISIGEDSFRLVARWNVHHSKDALIKKKELENYGKSLGLDLILTGKMPLFHDLTPYVVSTFFESFLLAFTLITVLLILILGSVRIGLMALIPNIFPLSLGAALIHLTGRDVNMTISIIASVVIGIAVDDTIHFLFEYRRFERKGLGVEEILNKVFKQTGPALLYTTMMISSGFLVLWFGQYRPNRDFGLFVSLLLIFALYADFFILPAIFWKFAQRSRSKVVKYKASTKKPTTVI